MQTKKELQSQLKSLKLQKDSLVVKKNKGTITPEETDKLSEVVMAIIDAEEALEAIEKAAAMPVANSNYQVSPKEAHLYHVLITKGSKFDPETGKPLNTPYKQIFTAPEYAQLKTNAPSLGIKIDILHQPVKK